MEDSIGTALGGSSESLAAAVGEAAEDQEVVLVYENGGGVLSAEEDSKGGENILEEITGNRDVNFGCNRWPRQETLALLKLRSDMDATFRDSSLKGPLWEEISRKLEELGYKRSAKKCKEKFENVYKYHKRTKDSRRASPGKSDGKAYRYFEQLEAFELENHHPPPKPQPNIISTPSALPNTTNYTTLVSNNFMSTTPNPTITTSILIRPTTSNIQETKVVSNFPPPQNYHKNHSPQPALVFSCPESSSSTASDEEFQTRHKRRRKWKDFLRQLTRQVVRKQEEMQKRFLETVVKCENEWATREEAWRAQEMSRISREHEMLVQERSAAAAKDTAVIAFLQKLSAGVSDQDNTNTNIPNTSTTVQANVDKVVSMNKTNNDKDILASITLRRPPPPQTSTTFQTNEAIVVSATPPPIIATRACNLVNSSCSRWPKAEVEALINLRTTLELKYQENGPKGPLWEEISAAMRQLGYVRSSKRCKEKWENINKYFKKVKENNKKRSEDSKTCPYFHKLDALYREKRSKNVNMNQNHQRHAGVMDRSKKSPPPWFGTEPLMVQPERQWPLHHDNNLDILMNSEEEKELEDDEDRESSSTEVDERHRDEGTRSGESYEIVSNKHSSMDMVE